MKHPFEMRLQRELNPPQLEAVTYTDGPLLVLAGAGSGKTRVITYRIAYLMAVCGLAPWNVLAVTFTNKAAGEMAERVEAIQGGKGRGLWIGTFHSICSRILRKDGGAAGIDPRFVIYDRSDQGAAMKQAFAACGISDKKIHPNAALNAISKAKGCFQTPEQYRQTASDDFELLVSRLYEEYRKIMKANNALDFDDLLMETVLLLTQRPEIGDVYRKRFQHILVDEYQDTNPVQYLLLRELSMEHRQICAVGDDDQSIYRWRGATIRNILEFERDFPGVRKVFLEQNYRSTKTILAAASELVKHNKGRHEKTLWTQGDAGEKIGVVQLPDERSEAVWIGDTIQSLHEEENIPYRDMAVFYRTNAQSRVFEEECIQRGVPYQMVGATAFYERKEIKDVLAYCRLLLNPADTVAFQRAVNLPKRKLGQTSVDKLLDYAARTQRPILDAARMAREEPEAADMRTATGEAFFLFAQLFTRWREKYRKSSLSKLMDAIVTESGYRAMLEGEPDPQNETRLENVEELVNAAGQFGEGLQKEISAPLDALALLEAFMENITLKSDIDEMEEGADALVFMTLHSAKGLEFPCVFMAGMEDGLLPHKQSMNSKEELEEERRLCYVGITRAKKRLYMTYADMRRMYNTYNYHPSSRFLDEIPSKYKEKMLWRGHDAAADWGMGRAGGLKRKVDEDFEPGDMVNHRSFGFGVILAVDGEGGSARITIDFQEVGKKTLVQEYARLEKV